MTLMTLEVYIKYN